MTDRLTLFAIQVVIGAIFGVIALVVFRRNGWTYGLPLSVISAFAIGSGLISLGSNYDIWWHWVIWFPLIVPALFLAFSIYVNVVLEKQRSHKRERVING